jgi:hypothetical protein
MFSPIFEVICELRLCLCYRELCKMCVRLIRLRRMCCTADFDPAFAEIKLMAVFNYFWPIHYSR